MDSTNITIHIPEFYVHASDCPQCGAPIYHDGKAPRTAHGHYKELPVPYYTCTCRLNAQTFPYIPPCPTYPVQPWQPTGNDTWILCRTTSTVVPPQAGYVSPPTS